MFVFTPEDLIKVLIAVVIGGIIGMEREIHSKAAGLRTITLITIGATIFTILSEKFGDPSTSRIAANIVTGIGFLGAGVILFAEGKLKGLTTASSIWVAAALGMAVGVGEYPCNGDNDNRRHRPGFLCPSRPDGGPHWPGNAYLRNCLPGAR
jgi:putative Mg2+ transporter-C (MgtC) family protein